MEVGSAVNWTTVGAAGVGAGGGGVATGAGAAGGGIATFFLQPAANIASRRASPMTVNFRLLNMNESLLKLCYLSKNDFPQTGVTFSPPSVNFRTFDPSASIV